MVQFAWLLLLGVLTKADDLPKCPRPGGWCYNANQGNGVFYTDKLDCDGDGKPDPFCSYSVGHHAGMTGFRSSAQNCADTWHKGSCKGRKLAQKLKVLPCYRDKNSWCNHQGGKYSGDKDCDGDFIPDPFCEDKTHRGALLSGFSCLSTWGWKKDVPKCEPPRARAISVAYHVCANREGAGRSNIYSTNVGPENLPACIAYVHNTKNCGGQFSYGIKDGWCDCVVENKIPCKPANDGNPGIYTTYTLQGRWTKSSLNLQVHDHLCENRGSLGGNGDYSTIKKGNYGLMDCSEWVSHNSKCGPYFSYSHKDGYCDCVPEGKGHCKLFTDEGTKIGKYAAYSQAKKYITIGPSNHKKKCVHYPGMWCFEWAGNKHHRVNDHWGKWPDRFKITTTKTQVCAERTDGGSWGMELQILCTFTEIPAHQAKVFTTATHHLCENRGSIGGKGLYSKQTKPGEFMKCEAWVRTNKACGTHFSYSWKDGYCDCVPKGKGYCHLYTDAGTIQGQYSAYEIYTTTTTPPPPTPRPTPRPPPPPVKGLKSGMGWKVTKGKCTIDISTNVPCAVSSNYPKKYLRDEKCEITFTKEKKKTSRLHLTMNTEKYFDYVTVDGKEYHGTFETKVPIKSKKFTWSADFFEEAKGKSVGWKICKTAAKDLKVPVEDKKNKGKNKGKKPAKGKKR